MQRCVHYALFTDIVLIESFIILYGSVIACMMYTNTRCNINTEGSSLINLVAHSQYVLS